MSDAWRMRPRGRTTTPLSTITSSLERSIASTTGPLALTTTTAGFSSKTLRHERAAPARVAAAVGPAEAQCHEAALAALVAAVLVRLFFKTEPLIQALRPVAP